VKRLKLAGRLQPSALNNAILMNELRNDHAEPISLVSDRDSNQAPAKHKPEALALEPSLVAMSKLVAVFQFPAGMNVNATFSCED